MDDPAALSPDETQVRVFLLDDHEIVLRGIADLLQAEPGFVVVGEAATAAEALRRIPAAQPHVAVLDARLPDGSGIEVCRSVRSSHPQIRCLILTSYDDNDAIFAAVMAGAAGYLLKEIRGTSLWTPSARSRRASPCWIRRSPSGYSPGCVKGSRTMSAWNR